MPLIVLNGHVTRQMVRDIPAVLWLFGDNMLREGFGGQAKEMRGEPNALGIATKWAPGTSDDDYFAPGDWHDPKVQARMKMDFGLIATFLRAGGSVYLPGDGIGMGMAQLQDRAPIFLDKFDQWFEALKKIKPLKLDGEP